LAGFCAQAQICGYYYVTSNAVITMSVMDAQGKQNGKVVYTVGTVTNAGGTYNAPVASLIYDRNGKQIFSANGNFQCKGGQLMVDMSMSSTAGPSSMMKNMQFKINQSYLTYPSSLHVGESLQDANLSITGSNNSRVITSTTINITNRKVVRQESITTPAGTWNCFKISYTNMIQTKTMGMGFPITMSGMEWFAPGFGLVKSESFDKNNRLTGSTELTAYVK
jgi:hypothetical protein